jgi:two-component sensor histidine kinase
MKGVAILRKLFYSSWFLASIPAIVIISFFPPKASRYNLEIEEKGVSLANTVCCDLDSNGTSELINWGVGIPLYHILIRDASYRIYDQINFKDDIDPDLGTFFTGNYDKDRYKEIYVITYHGDSLFLNIIEFFDKEGIKKEHIFISDISSVRGKVTSTFYPAGFFDVNGDGYDELYFIIYTGFGLKPRKVFYYDINKDKLTAGAFTGSIIQAPMMTDADGDGKPEIFGRTGASGNYDAPVPFTDWSSWLMVFDANLKFKFPPVEFKGLTGNVEVKPFTYDGRNVYLVSYTTSAADSMNSKPRLMIFSEEGKLLKERLYRDIDPDLQNAFMVTSDNGRIRLFANIIVELDSDLKTSRVLELPFNDNFVTPVFTDIDMDGHKDVLLFSMPGHQMAVYNSSLELIGVREINFDVLYHKISNLVSHENNTKLLLSQQNDSYLLKLVRKKYYYLGFLSYPGVYLLCLLFIMMVRRITTWQISQKEDLKRRLITLQLQGIKSQLDPHFTFNTLNSVASLIYLEDRETAYDYLNKFTRLLRSMLNDAERVYRRLSEELEFVTTYLELEKLRFGDKFEYTIEIGEGVTQREEVPKMVLHTFAENAVKHGIIPKQEGGRLIIKIERQNDYLRLIISDNGIGRASSAGQSSSTGKGLKLTGEFYEILNQINKRHIRHTITDIYNETGEPAGTLAEVWVPV